jgi:hypothetical protein
MSSQAPFYTLSTSERRKEVWMLAQPCPLAYAIHFTKWKAAHLIQIILNAELAEEY